MSMKRFWRHMPTTAFNGDTSEWIAVLPLAAIEQHGPHLPVGVDALVAEGMVARCADALPANSLAVFLPVQEVCKSNEHISFPGTLTIGWQAAMHSWIDIGESVARAGIRKIVLITSHGGNNAPMDIVARELRQHHNMLAITTSWSNLGDWSRTHTQEGVFVDIHGGDYESSIMLELYPELVDMTKAVDFNSAQEALKSRNTHLGYHTSDANIAWLSQDLNLAGTVGDASAATKDKGALEVAAAIEGFCTLMQEISATAPPKSKI